MNINEIFLSIQGESNFSGLPCILIRFCGCNLNCSYCDTQYHTEINETLTPHELCERIQAYSPVKLVELTGGEPLLQPDLSVLISLLYDRKYQILIETNGSIGLSQIPDYVHKIIDVKCPDSGEGKSFLKENLLYFKPERDNLKF
nr:radical SAM protein [Candidatus Cloacimonadota bacterium]